jgi:hypothetical protein
MNERDLYLDTEFNGFGGQLISLALVSPTGDDFYAVCPKPTLVHPWVAEHVMPHLRLQPITWHRFRNELADYLRRHNHAEVYADWPEDFVHLMQMICSEGGHAVNVQLSLHLIDTPDLSPCFTGSMVRHNAHDDATAMMRWHLTTKG